MGIGQLKGFRRLTIKGLRQVLIANKRPFLLEALSSKNMKRAKVCYGHNGRFHFQENCLLTTVTMVSRIRHILLYSHNCQQLTPSVFTTPLFVMNVALYRLSPYVNWVSLKTTQSSLLCLMNKLRVHMYVIFFSKNSIF